VKEQNCNHAEWQVLGWKKRAGVRVKTDQMKWLSFLTQAPASGEMKKLSE